jgi:hypothetical protein
MLAFKPGEVLTVRARLTGVSGYPSSFKPGEVLTVRARLTGVSGYSSSFKPSGGTWQVWRNHQRGVSETFY